MLALLLRVICGEQMLYVVTLKANCYYIMRSAICYIIDCSFFFHINAMGLITTRGWALQSRAQKLFRTTLNFKMNYNFDLISIISI